MFLRTLAISLSLSMFATAALHGQTGALIYDNGTFITGDSSEVCGDASGSPNTSSPATGTTGGVESYWAQGRVIDDFTIPPGESWMIQTIRWRVYQTGTIYDALIPTAYVRIWASDPQLGGDPFWGDFETNRHENSTFSGVYRTALTNLASCARAIKNVDIDVSVLPPLPPGRYWIEVGFDSELPGGLFSSPTEPRRPTDNGLRLDFSGVVQPAVDGGSAEPLEFPFQLYGSIGTETTGACVLPGGACVDTTLDDCVNSQGGTWNYLHPCAALGACCNHADGTCEENVGAETCQAAGNVFSVGQPCSSIPNCGQSIGACCYPDDNPTHCQILSRGVDCVAAGGVWHTGSCASASCDDTCATARRVFDGQNFFDNIGYTTDGPLTPNACGNSPFVGQADAWFRYTSTLDAAGGSIEFSLCGASFDTTLQVYQVDAGTNCDDLAATSPAIYCDDDGCGENGASYLSVPAAAGDVFLLRVGGFDGASGSGTLAITPLASGAGTCCSLSSSCRVVTESECAVAVESFTPGVLCVTPGFDCPPSGACCMGVFGCEVRLRNRCEQDGGVFLGDGVICGAPDDCDGDGETDRCAVAVGAPDCNANGIPDSCDVSPNGSATDCDANGVPDSCQPPANCCPGDVNADRVLDSRDIQAFLTAMFDAPPFCFSRAFCRMDVNGDFSFDGNDIVPLVDALLAGNDCPILMHVSGRVDTLNEEGQVTGRANKVFVLDAEGTLLYAYDQTPNAAADDWGYRDGASDGTHVYFGWIGGVSRHDADGGNGTQIIFGAVPGTGATWRALAFDPTGDGGAGSLWTQSFTSELVETDLSGNLLNFYFNDLNLYGLAYDRETGMLWGHHLDATDASAVMVEIDPADGQPTGTSFPSHFNVSGGALNGFAQYGGVSFDPGDGDFYGLLQGAPEDAIFRCDRFGNLAHPPVINPRADLNAQTSTTRNLGIAVVRP